MAMNVGMAVILYFAAIACCLSTSTRRKWTCGNDTASSVYFGAMALMRKRYENVLVTTAYVTHFAWSAPLSMEIYDHSPTLSFSASERCVPGSNIGYLKTQFSNTAVKVKEAITSSGLDIAY